MDLITFFIVLGLVPVVFLVIIWFSDCDLLLLWKCHFGVKTDALAGKIVWITGASSGIGEYLAYELSKVGCRLILSARRQGELERVKKECLLRGPVKDGDVLVLKLDVLDFKSLSKAHNDVIDHFGKVDILVNNAGRSQRALAVDISEDVEREIMELNHFSVLSLSKLVLPKMIERKEGHIVVTSSLAGKIGAPFSASYSATKFALQGWFDSLRTEQAENNINVTMVCPGPVFSNLLEVAFTGKPGVAYEKSMQANEKRLSTQRCAELMAVGMANKMYEVWISGNPPLLFTYMSQYSPTLAKWIAGRIGLKAIKRMREGQQ